MALYYDCPECNAYNLSQIFIDERYQHKGYGKLALKLILERMRKENRFDTVTLCYVEGNHEAKILFERLGFKYIDKDEDEIIMERKLDYVSI